MAGSIINNTGSNVFNNAGTLQVDVLSGTTTIGVAFNNSGTVDVKSGTLELSGGGTDVGALYEGAGTIEFGGGTRTLDANSTINTANVEISGGDILEVRGFGSHQRRRMLSGRRTGQRAGLQPSVR